MGCFYVYGSQRGFVQNVQNKSQMINWLLSSEVLLDSNVYVINNGRIIVDTVSLVTDGIYHIIPRLVGGKGGFGSMLRAIGAQIEKTTSREACRDLSGRRMRDVNNEKKLKDWLSKQSDREREKEEKRKERLERRRHQPQHKFDDPKYVEQKNKVVVDLEDALQRGLEKSKSVSATVTSETAGCSGLSMKRKATDNGKTDKSKKNKGWLGLDPSLNLSDLDTSDEESEGSTSDSNSSQDKLSTISVNEQTVSIETTSKETVESTEVQKSSPVKPNSLLSSLPPPVNQVNLDNEGRRVMTVESTEVQKSSPVQPNSSLSSLPPPVNQVNLDNEPVILDDYNSVQELEEVGLNRLKLALMDRGLKCGGTLTQRAERLYSVKGVKQEDINPSLFAKPLKKK